MCRPAEGQLLYFVAGDGAFGTMAERTVVDRRRAALLPDDADVSAIAAAANLQLLGSGQGSLTTAGIVAELPELADQITARTFVVDPVPTPLSDVESAWNAPTAPGQRIVFTT